ncbi:MAG: thioredoxin domain-containing protein [Parcubacteria group bacterium]|nr:thioredoxin domain-containing protein [Parcubacteria group bacterium]
MSDDKAPEQKKVPKNNTFWVPVAIILAGAIIAGSVIYSGNADLTGSVEEALPEPPAPPEPGTEEFEVSIDDDTVKGSKDAKVQIVEFSDYECPYCARNAETIEKIAEEYGDKVAIVFRDFPLDFHADAQKAAEAAECAGEQGKYWEYHDELFANQDSLEVPDLKGYAKELKLKTAAFDKCLDSDQQKEEVENDMTDGQAVEVTGTPATFINGRKISGAYPFEDFAKIIDEELGK